MRKTRELSQKIIESTKPIVKNLTDTSLPERRSGIEDRRKIHSYIWNDRRSGIADRRTKAKVKTLMTLSEDDLRRIFK